MQNANNKILGISDLSSECNEEIPLVIEGYQFFSNISQVIRNIKLGIANLSVFWVMILPVWYYFRRTVFLILSALSSCIVDMTSRKVFNQFIDRIVYWFTELEQRSCEQNCENDNYTWKSIVITSCFGDKSDWNMRFISDPEVRKKFYPHQNRTREPHPHPHRFPKPHLFSKPHPYPHPHHKTAPIFYIRNDIS